MKINLSLVLHILISYVYRSEGVPILEEVTNFLFPTKPKTTVAPFLPTYKVIASSWQDGGGYERKSTWPEDVSESSRNRGRNNNIQNNLGNNVQREQLGTGHHSEAIDNQNQIGSSYETTTVSHVNNEGIITPINTIQKRDNQSTKLNNTNNASYSDNLCNDQNTLCNKNIPNDQKQFVQGKETTIRPEEDGLIVFPTESPSVDRQYHNNMREYNNSTHTTERTAKAHVPVNPVDSGRRIFDAPKKECPLGEILQDGHCRKPLRK